MLGAVLAVIMSVTTATSCLRTHHFFNVTTTAVRYEESRAMKGFSCKIVHNQYRCLYNFEKSKTTVLLCKHCMSLALVMPKTCSYVRKLWLAFTTALEEVNANVCYPLHQFIGKTQNKNVLPSMSQVLHVNTTSSLHG